MTDPINPDPLPAPLPSPPFDWKVMALKGLKVLGHIAIAGAIAYYAGNPYLVMVAPLLTMIDNWLNHA